MPTANSSRCQPQIHLEAGRNLPERTVRGEYRIRAHVPGCLAGLLHKAKDFPHQPSDHLYLCPQGRIPDPHEFALSVMLNVKAGGICKDFMTKDCKCSKIEGAPDGQSLEQTMALLDREGDETAIGGTQDGSGLSTEGPDLAGLDWIPAL